MTRHVALLRAVNVGGGAKIAMADLRATAAAIGFTDIATVLQSGSLVFSEKAAGPALERRLTVALRDKLSLSVEVMVRSASQWHEIVAGNPFPGEARSDPSHLLLLALKRPAGPDAEAALRAAIVGREAIVVTGAIAYVTYPDGIGRSKLTTAVLERHLGLPVTGRNWSTVLKIAAQLGVSAGLSASVN